MTSKSPQRSGWRRTGVAIMAAAAVALPLAACSQGSAGEGDREHPSGTLQILVSSADASDAAFTEVTDAFEEKYPDVTVKLSSVANDNYEATLSSRLTANNVDIFVAKSMSEPPSYAEDSESDSVRLAKAGGMLDLSDEDFMDRFEPTVLDSLKLDGTDYVVPTGLSYTTGTYYNKTIFADNGIEPPTTYDDLIAACEKLSAAGITPYGIGGKEEWPAGLFMLAAAEGLYPSAEDKEDLAAGIWDGSVTLTDDGPLEILERVQSIYEYAQPNFAGTSYDSIPSGFASGDYAMIADGTWNQPVIDQAVNGAFEYGYIPTPMGDTAEDNDHLTGKIELMLAVNAASKNSSAALAWLDFFSEADTYKGFLKTSGFSSAEPGIDQSDFMASLSDYTEDFRTPWSHYWFASNTAGQEAVYPFNYPALSPLGASSAEEAAEAAAKAWSASS